MNIPNERLSEAEIHVLDAFLMSDSTPEDVLAIDELHGYLTAIVCCPGPVMPSDWLAGVWQTEEGRAGYLCHPSVYVLGLRVGYAAYW